jgi:short-subunit dehydrogenase involved in D-alanine esterification of teichoic acids
LALRHQLARLGIKVFEVVPPALEASRAELDKIFQQMNSPW